MLVYSVTVRMYTQYMTWTSSDATYWLGFNGQVPWTKTFSVFVEMIDLNTNTSDPYSNVVGFELFFKKTLKSWFLKKTLCIGANDFFKWTLQFYLTWYYKMEIFWPFFHSDTFTACNSMLNFTSSCIRIRLCPVFHNILLNNS